MKVHGLGSVLLTLMLDVVIGFVGAFVVFLFVYGFSDHVEPLMHGLFLIGYALVAMVAALISYFFVRAMATPRAWRVAAWTTAVAYLAALAAGTLISLAHEDDGSITAGQGDAPFVALVVGCAAAAVAAAWRLARAVRGR